MTQNKYKIIGLTGGIATGKSTASQYIQSKGYPVIDADLIARTVVKQGQPALQAIEETFGDEVITQNGELNRSKLRSIVFNDQGKLDQLNQITHPRIIQQIKEKISLLKEKYNIIVVDAPLLIEANMQSIVDEVWLVSLDQKTQIKRLMTRDHIGEQEALKIIDKQLSLEEKKQYADHIIDNSKDKSFLYRQLDRLLSITNKEVMDV